MRIMLYKDNLLSGRGADRAVVALAEALASRHEAILVTKSGHGDIDAAVRVVRCPEASDMRAAIAEARPDVIVSAGTNETLDLAAIYPESFPCPVVHQFHVYPPTAFKRKRFIRNWRMRRAIRRCAAVQVLLPAYASSARRWLGEKVRIAVIGNAVNVGLAMDIPSAGKVAGGTAKPVGIEKHPRIAYPAAINADKRQELLIRAFALMGNRGAVLSLYGNGKPKFVARLKRLAHRLGVAGRIRFEGYCGDPAAVYADADLVAFPSRVEGFGMVITEAAAFGKRTVACSDCLASAELVPRFGGILSEATPMAYAEALDRALAESGNMDKDRVRNALDEFSPASVYGSWERLLESLVKGG